MNTYSNIYYRVYGKWELEWVVKHFYVLKISKSCKMFITLDYPLLSEDYHFNKVILFVLVILS